jgi:hypothetical protein
MRRRGLGRAEVRAVVEPSGPTREPGAGRPRWHGAVALSYGVDHGYPSWAPDVAKLAMAVWVVAHLQGFLRGLLARRDRAPTLAVFGAVLFVPVLSLLWVSIDSYSTSQGQVL